MTKFQDDLIIFKTEGGSICAYLDERTGESAINSDNATIDTPFQVLFFSIFRIAKLYRLDNLRKAIIKYGMESPLHAISRDIIELYPELVINSEEFYVRIAANTLVTLNYKKIIDIANRPLIKQILLRIKSIFSGRYADISIFDQYSEMSFDELGRELFCLLTDGKQIIGN